MAGEMFGGPIGISQRNADDNQSAVAAMKVLESAGDLSMMPAKQEALLATAAHHRMQVQVAQQELATQKAVAGEMSRLAPTFAQSEDPADFVQQQGMAYLRAGDPKKARESFNTASQMRARATTAEMNVQRGNYYQQQTELAPQRLEQNADYRNRRLEQIDEGHVLQQRNQRRIALDSAQDRALREAELARREAADAARQRNAGAKSGGGAAHSTAREQGDAKKLLKDAGLSLDGEAASLAAMGVADEAKARSKANRGLTFEAAAKQVIEEERAAGVYQTSKRSFLGLFDVPGTSQTVRAGSKANPVKTVPLKASDRKNGVWYDTAQGPMQWNNGWPEKE